MSTLMEPPARTLPSLREKPTATELEDYARSLGESMPDSEVGPAWLAAVLCELPFPSLPCPVPHPYPVWRHLFLLTRWAKLRRMVTVLLGDVRDCRYHSGESRRLFREIVARVDALKGEWARAAWQDADVTAREEAAIAALYAMTAEDLVARGTAFHVMPLNDLLRELIGCD